MLISSICILYANLSRWWVFSWDYNPELHDRVSSILDRKVLEPLLLFYGLSLNFSLIFWFPSIQLLTYDSYSINMLDEFGPAQHKLVKYTNLCANFSWLILLFRGRPFLVVTGSILEPYNVIYHSSSYLGLLLSFEEYVLSAVVIVGRYLFLYIQAISEYLLANLTASFV